MIAWRGGDGAPGCGEDRIAEGERGAGRVNRGLGAGPGVSPARWRLPSALQAPAFVGSPCERERRGGRTPPEGVLGW